MGYSIERKQAVLRKLLPPYNRTVADLAKEEGVSTAAIYQWRKAARAKGQLLPENSAEPEGWSTQDKFNAVLETAALAEAELAEYCRRRGLCPERQRSKALELELRRKEAALAETAALLTLRKKANAIWGGRGQMTSIPDRERAIELVDEVRQAGARQAAACAEIGIDAKTYRAWKQDTMGDRRPMAERPPQPHALTDAEQCEILEQCHRPEFASLPPAQIIARLLDEEGRYIASASSFYGVLRRAGEQQRRGRAAPPRQLGPPRRHQATGPNEVYTWDVTYLPSLVRGLFFYLYLIVDLYSRKIVGSEVFLGESAANSQQVIERALLREGVAHRQIVLHGDNGPAMKAATLTARLDQLGVTPSYSRPRVSDDNPFSEALFRTCKYRPDYPPNGFADVHEARDWVLGFVRWYNHEHRHSSLRYVTPQERREGLDKAILARRHAIYTAAKQAHPRRWSGRTRNWEPMGAVWLNPEKALEAA